MRNRAERAKELFKQGYNCSQSVVAAFYEDIGIDLETALKISSTFGGGIGRLREVCGAVSGMAMVLGMKYGYTDAKDYEAKTALYKTIQKLAEQFKNQNKSIVCRELLGKKAGPESSAPEPRSDEYYTKRPCVELVGFAAGALEQLIEQREQKEE